jgi:5-methylcytosine-specific restriction endonuclease McrA
LSLTLDEPTLNLIRRAQEVLAQKRKAPTNLAETLHAIAETFLEKEDPLRIAQRALKKPNGLNHSKHQARWRDQGRCQFKLPNGKICGSRFWVDLHHLKPRSEGGTDHVENLVTLCQSHHRLVHAPP